ncbi:MAG TPA: DNA recombination protein RmuC [Bacteroidia bacterium]|nr:DNA recombination protein RmuC [Bacteroidia bacterium]
MLDIVYLLVGIAIGVVATWLILKGKTSGQITDPRLVELDKKNAALSAQLDAVSSERKKSDDALIVSQNNSTELNRKLASREEELRGLNKRLDDQKAELENLQKQFTKEFENLANKIFEEKSKKFTEQNRTQLDDLLKPFGEKIKDFEKKVNDVYVNETKERASLKEQISQLHLLNQQMSKDAQNLTLALKGETKTQGNWGEYILETILEKSGLRKDHEYTTQQSMTGEDGNRLQPDVIVNLPEEKHIIIDSKVSLVAYERFVSSENEEEKIAALKEHVSSLRKHIRDLSEKNYQKLYQINSLDFVLLFMPIEPAFSTAIMNDAELFNDAIAKNIVIVSPSTLLATLRTIASIWRQENQNRNAQEIARLGGSMIDKLTGFIEDLIEVGRKMDGAKLTYEEAMKKLHSGRGNVITTAEKMKVLGAKADKSLPQNLVERATENDLPSGNEK